MDIEVTLENKQTKESVVVKRLSLLVKSEKTILNMYDGASTIKIDNICQEIDENLRLPPAIFFNYLNCDLTTPDQMKSKANMTV